jgi:hypothetical protein
MNQELTEELKEHIKDTVLNSYDKDSTNFEDLHFHAFNEDYYTVYYYQAEEWLKKHDISAFAAIETVHEYERDNFGEVTTTDINSVSVVNMYAYIKGEEVINDLGVDLNDIRQARLLELLK